MKKAVVSNEFLLSASLLKVNFYGYHECRPEWSIPERRIDDWQVMFILEGECFFILDRKRRIEMKRGDLVILNSFEPHEAGHYPGKNIKCVSVHFDISLFDGIGLLGRNSIVKNPVAVDAYFHLFTMLADDMRNGEAFPDEKIKGVFTYLVADMLGRGFLVVADGLSRDTSLVFVREFIDFIDMNIDRRLFIPDVCRELGISVSTLEKNTRKYLHTTPASLINSRKMKYAAGLLLKGSSVGECAEKTGFNDVFYFSRVFKKLNGVSPANYGKTI